MRGVFVSVALFSWYLLLVSYENNVAGVKCHFKDGSVLNDGETRNRKDPCVRQKCINGTKKTHKCPHVMQPGCTSSFPGNGPFPNCCGILACFGG